MISDIQHYFLYMFANICPLVNHPKILQLYLLVWAFNCSLIPIRIDLFTFSEIWLIFLKFGKFNNFIKEGFIFLRCFFIKTEGVSTEFNPSSHMTNDSKNNWFHFSLSIYTLIPETNTSLILYSVSHSSVVIQGFI